MIGKTIRLCAVLMVLTVTVLHADLDWGGGGARCLDYGGSPLSGDSAAAVLLAVDAGGTIDVADQGLDLSALLVPGATVQAGQKQSTVLAVSQAFTDGYLPNAAVPDISQTEMEALGGGAGAAVYMIVIDGVDNPATQASVAARVAFVTLHVNGNAALPATTYGDVFPMPTTLVIPGSATGTVHCDLLPGVTVTFDSSLSGLVANGAFYSTVSGTGLGAYRYSLNSAAWIDSATPAAPISLSGLAEGAQELRLLGGDGTGRWQPVRVADVCTWTVDTVGPTAPAVTGQTPTVQERPEWNWAMQGGGTGVFRYRLQSGTDDDWVTTSAVVFSPRRALADGAHTLLVQEQDEAGNWSASGTHTIVVDTTPPTITGLSDVSDSLEAYTWTWGAWDADGTVLFRHVVTHETTWTPTGAFSQTATASVGFGGVWFLHVQAADGLGNLSNVVTVHANLGDPYTIGGTLSYDGVHSGNLILDVFTEPECEQRVDRQIAASGARAVFSSELPAGTYYLRAFCDVNDDGVFGPGEPSGYYDVGNGDGVPTAVVVPDDQALSVDIVLELWADYELDAGWNLISFPGTPVDLTPKRLRKMAPDVVSAWKWAGQDFVGAGDSFEALVGYWFYVLRATRIRTVVVPSGATPGLGAGWNLFGVETQEEDLDAFFAPYAQRRDGSLTVLKPCWFWGDQQYRTARKLIPGVGYWGFGR